MKKIFTLFVAALMGLCAFAEVNPDYGPCPSKLSFALLNADNPAQVEIELQLANSSLNLNGFNMEVEKAEGSEAIQWKKVNNKYFTAEGYGATILARLEDSDDDEREELLSEMCDVMSNEKNGHLVIIELLSTYDCRFFPVLENPTGVGKFYLDMSGCDDGKYKIVAPDTPHGCSFSYTHGPEPLSSWTSDAPVVLVLRKEGDIITQVYENDFDFKVNGICYRINNDGKSVTVTSEMKSYPRYYNLGGDIVIPEVVTYNGITYSVTSINTQAFAGCTDITSIAIPNSLTSIGSSCFSGCTGFTSLTLTGQGAWNYSSSNYAGLGQIINQLNTVNIGCGITSLGNFGFDPNVVNSYAVTPPVCSSGTFASYGGELHVPITSIAKYFVADYWKNFNNVVNNLGKVTLDKSTAGLSVDETVELTATVVPQGLEMQWTTTNPLVAKVDENGVVTAIGEGECDIYATLASSSSAAYAICHITVFTLTFSDDALGMIVGDEATIVATISPDNIPLTPVWSSSDESVATVENGVVTAVGAGECDIFASVLGHTVICHVTVFKNMTVSLNVKNLIIGASQLLTIYPSCSPNVPVDLVVTSSDPSVALVRLVDRTKAPAEGLLDFNERGMAMAQMENVAASSEVKSPALAEDKAIMIVGVQNGTATITVTTADGKAIPAILELRVADVDGDYTITTTDVTALYNYLLSGDETLISTSDIDGDGYITTTDITILYNLLLGN